MRLADHPEDQAYVDDLMAANAALSRAFAAPMEEPVPPVLRDMIRMWVDRSAMQSTRLLRAYESRFGKQRTTRDGRVRSAPPRPPATAESLWLDCAKSHRPGACLEVTVRGQAADGAWATTAQGIEAFVLFGDGPRPAAGSAIAVRLLDRSEARRWCVAAPVAIAPDETLAGRHSEGLAGGWTMPEVGELHPGLRLPGRVTRAVASGVLVEVLPGVSGRLQVANMGGRDRRQVRGQVVVEILSIDFADERLELGLVLDEPAIPDSGMPGIEAPC
jgi:hypothetical protein